MSFDRLQKVREGSEAFFDILGWSEVFRSALVRSEQLLKFPEGSEEFQTF